MIPVDVLLVFITASIALGLAPGPDNIFVLTQSALNGRKAGILVTLGLCTGLIVHTAAVALGVAAIFQTSEIAFTGLKILGAVYLVYLAIQAFRASATKINGDAEAIAWSQLYIRGIIMNITNPKVAIFFLAFLPQFSDPARGSVTIQMLAFGGLFIICAFVVMGSIAWFSGFLGEWLKNSDKAQVYMNRIAGLIFIGLALRLIISER